MLWDFTGSYDRTSYNLARHPQSKICTIIHNETKSPVLLCKRLFPSHGRMSTTYLVIDVVEIIKSIMSILCLLTFSVLPRHSSHVADRVNVWQFNCGDAQKPWTWFEKSIFNRPIPEMSIMQKLAKAGVITPTMFPIDKRSSIPTTHSIYKICTRLCI